MNIEVRYYSKSGNTKKVADAIAKKAGGSPESICEQVQDEVDILFETLINVRQLNMTTIKELDAQTQSR